MMMCQYQQMNLKKQKVICAFGSEEYSEEESEEEEEEEIEEETEEEENQQTKYSPKQKHEGNERNQMTTQRKAQTKMLRSRPTVVKPKTTTVKVSLQNFPKSKI
ncbi:hypothetical protein GPJ56_006624 [Histomonas meleagridis]|nr:hypothetical protein GPJ56_006624 [Histomonas meleagridis]